MDIATYLENVISESSALLTEDDFIIKGIWKVEMFFEPSQSDSTYNDYCLIVQTNAGTGYCTCLSNKIKIDRSLIGKDYRTQHLDWPLKIACIDSIFSKLHTPAKYVKLLKGSPNKKASERAKTITKEILCITNELFQTKSDVPAVQMIGAVGSIIELLIKSDLKVFASDFDKNLIGSRLAGIEVVDGSKNEYYIEKADICLFTGMTLVTHTFAEILKQCLKHKTIPVVFSQTGCNLASQYIKLGASVVIAESFPNYIFPGDTYLSVYNNH